VIEDGEIIRCRDNSWIAAQFAIYSQCYAQTGPGTGYRLNSLKLGDENGIIAENVYLDSELGIEELDKLMRAASLSGCRLWDIRFVVEVEPQTWQLAALDESWTPLLCGSLEKLNASDRSWWRQWCQPDFGMMGRQTVDSQTVSEHLDRLISAYPWIEVVDDQIVPAHGGPPAFDSMMVYPRPGEDINDLRALLARHASVDIVTGRAHDEETERARGKRGLRVSSHDESGIINIRIEKP